MLTPRAPLAEAEPSCWLLLAFLCAVRVERTVKVDRGVHSSRVVNKNQNGCCFSASMSGAISFPF